MPIREQRVISNRTEAEILALTGLSPVDIYISSDTDKVFKVQPDGTATEDLNTDVVYVTVVDGEEGAPVLNISKTNDIYRLDGLTSNNGAGAFSGIHQYYFSGQRDVLDYTQSTPAILAPGLTGGNVAITGNDGGKAIAGNSWNAAIKSTNSINTIATVACSWLVESVTGTIREMCGITTTPDLNDSYTGIDYAIYQVNANVYVYERGSNRGANLLSIPLAVNDRLGIRLENGTAYYFRLRGTTEEIFYTSSVPAAYQTDYFFDCSLNRGVGSSGASEIEDVVFHTGAMAALFNVSLAGPAGQSISEEDKAKVKAEAGIEIEANALYSDVYYKRPNPFFNYPMSVLYTHIVTAKTITENIPI